MKVTYLLGAGASAESVPTVSQFKDELLQFKNGLTELMNRKNSQFMLDTYPTPISGTLLNDISTYSESQLQTAIQICDDLFQIAKTHPSIDTYGRKLTLSDAPEAIRQLFDFKCKLTFFISLVEMIKIPDKRYDLWLASILKKKNNMLHLPTEINVISWNYDSQIERVFVQYMADNGEKDELKRCNNMLNVVYPGNDSKIRRSQSNLVKLNGGAQFCNSQGQPETAGFSRTIGFDRNKFNSLVETYNNAINSFTQSSAVNNVESGNKILPMISFAWEHTSHPHENDLKWILENTDKLIVIGYSFPDFNRSVDARILGYYGAKPIQIVGHHNDIEQVKKKAWEATHEARTGHTLEDIKTDTLGYFPIDSTIRSF